MIILPAIDLSKGRCVRLRQGDPNRQTVFSEDPAQAARHWALEGAPWLHVVDLDGAFSGSPQNRAAIAAILQAVSVPVQLGGGLRSLEQIEEALALGVARVVLGTAAVEDPELVQRAAERYPGRIAVGIDAREGRVAVRGWKELTDWDAIEFGQRMARLGAAWIVYTDIARDGMMIGPNWEGIAAFAQALQAPVIASGGISCLEDIHRLAELEPLGVVGAIVGRALYEGAFSLREALHAAGG